MPATLDEEWSYWDGKATELRRTQLATVQNAATKWSALLTAALGLFSAVAFAGGLTTLDKLDSPFSFVAKILTTVAAGSDLVAIAIFAIVAGGIRLAVGSEVTAETVRDMNTVQSDSVVGLFRWGRIAAVLAAVAVLAGSAMILWAPQASSSPTSVVLLTEGKAYCGELAVGSDGSVTVGDLVVGSAIEQILPVTKCPSEAEETLGNTDAAD